MSDEQQRPTPQEALRLASALDLAAHDDLETFAQLVMRDERTGNPVRLATHHRQLFRRWRQHGRTVSWAPSEFGKSACLAALVAWRLGRDPGLRVAIISATREQAARLLRLVVIIISSAVYARIFPAVRVERSTADELSVTGRSEHQKDVSVTAGAFDLSSLLGARFDVIAADDVVTRESTRTQAARDRAFQDWQAVTGSRVSPTGAIHVVNTAEHSDDIPHRLSRLPGWDAARYPAIDSAGNPTWPERWPAERVEARRLELGPVGFARAMLCEPIDAATLVFSAADIERALSLGSEPHLSPFGGRVVIGVDPAWTVGDSADESGIVMVTIDDAGFRYVTHVEGLRVPFDRLAARVTELARLNRATVYVESNGAGGVIAEIIGRRAPCKPLPTTATSKRARVEALSAELASGRWVFRQPLGYPSGGALQKLCGELVAFSFESHCGDRASALLIACEGVRAQESRPKARWHTLDLTNR